MGGTIVRPTEAHQMEKAANRVKIKETRRSNLKERRRRRGVMPRARAERAEARRLAGALNLEYLLNTGHLEGLGVVELCARRLESSCA